MDVLLSPMRSISIGARDADGAVDVRMDALFATALLFVIVVVPPLLRIRMMYTACWLFFTTLTHFVIESDAARGIATSMGITIMVGWYTLRIFDRYAFTAVLNGWLGVWASSPALGFLARVGDFLIHLVLPMLLISCYLPLVRVWMSIPALISSRLWSHFVVGGGVFPKADHVYRFSPPRSQHFWNAAYKMELMLNMFVPLFCVLAHQDFVVRDDSFWLDWMSDGLVAIGESYVGGLWGVNASKTLDEVIAGLMTIPMEARQEMYRSWSARFVALAARLFNYAPSSVGLVVGAASEQFDLCPKFRRDYMDRYLHQGFGVWGDGVTNIEEGHCVLDLNIGSWGGVGCYLAEQHEGITVVCVLSSIQELVHVKAFADEHGVLDQMEFILAETPDKLLTTLSGFHASNFDRIVCSGVVETLVDSQKLRFLRTIKRVQKSHALMLLEFIACSTARTTTHGWNNKYVNSSFPCYPFTLAQFRMLVDECAFTVHEIAAYSQHYEQTFLEWHRRFQARWHDDDDSQQQLLLQGRRLGRLSSGGSVEAAPLDRDRSLPESFKRTWEFYLLHSAACFRAQALQVYQTPYYYNRSTGESSWEVPEGYAESESGAVADDGEQGAAVKASSLPPKWRKYFDDSAGKPYYYDEANGVTQWEEPEGFVDVALDDEGDGDDNEHDSESDDDEEQPPVRVAEAKADQSEEADQAEGPEQTTAAAVETQSTEGKPVASANDPASHDTPTQATSEHKWVKHIDASSGKPYYHDTVSGKTQWEEPADFVDASPMSAAAAEYQAHLTRVRTERLTRVTQQVLDPTGSLGRLNAILSGIDSGNTTAPLPEDDGVDDAQLQGAIKKVEWQQHVDPHTQRFYYHNTATGVTQWQKPDAPIMSGLADWVPPEVSDPQQDAANRKTVSGVNYTAKAKFNRITGKYEQMGGDDYWHSMGVANDKAGRQMSHFFDMTDLEKNREEAKLLKEKLKRKNIDWKKIAAEKKAKKQKQKNEWMYQD
ncbi:Ww domain-binding protein 4, partial [Globisporangium splendens]